MKLDAQILDDSTKLVYGPNTLTFIKLEDQKNNTDLKHSIDTSLYNLGNFSVWDQQQKKYQDLGVNGTALRSLFFSSPENIGLRSGYDAYNLYAQDAENTRYYDTKSPFINLYAGLGGVGRSFVDFDFSRNIKENINFGFGIERLTSDKQIGPVSSNGDRNAESTNLDLNGYYRSNDGKYIGMMSVNRFNTLVNETGGVLLLEDDNEDDVFAYEDAAIRLTGVNETDIRLNLHIYQEYKPGKAIQFYHELDFSRQKVTYKDENNSGTSGDGFDQFKSNYSNFFLDSLSTSESHSFRVFQNEIGIKGDISKGFYRAYIKRRDILGVFRYLDNRKVGEVYLGGLLRYDLNEKNTLRGDAEFLQTGDFKIHGNIKNKFFEASYDVKQYQPSLLQQTYFGNHFFWENNFNSTFTNQLKGNLNISFKDFSFKPKISLTTVSDFIYFNQQALPEQASDNLVFNSYGLDWSLRKTTSAKNQEFFGFDGNVEYTQIAGGASENYSVPEWFLYGKFYWEGFIFNNSMQVQIGADLVYKTSYFAYDYSYASQQYFLQDQVLQPNYFLADLFINFKVEKVSVFFKWNHFNQQNNEGFQITPLYPVQQKALDLGVRWYFFD